MAEIFTDVDNVTAGNEIAIVDPISCGFDVDDATTESRGDGGFDDCVSCGQRNRTYTVVNGDMVTAFAAFVSGTGNNTLTDDRNAWDYTGRDCELGTDVTESIQYGRGMPSQLTSSFSLDTAAEFTLTVVGLGDPPGAPPIHS